MSDRPELAVREGCARPLDLPRGEFSCSTVDGELVVDRADPRILISAELLTMISQGGARECVSLDLPAGETGGDGFLGALMKIRGANRNVVYRITEHTFAVDGYIGEWPE